MTSSLPVSEPVVLASLVTPQVQGIASRVLAKSDGGSMTVFAFDAGQGLTEHTSPFDALVLVLDGAFTVTVGGVSTTAPDGTIVRLPAAVPHALQAGPASRMLLVMLREKA